MTYTPSVMYRVHPTVRNADSRKLTISSRNTSSKRSLSCGSPAALTAALALKLPGRM